MNELKDSKETVYDQIIIPEELNQIVKKAIAEHPRNEMEERRKLKIYFRKSFIKLAASAAAVVLLFFTTALNTSEAFANNMNKIPLLGSVAHVLTFRSYHSEDENQNIDVKVPQVEMDNTQKGNDRKDTTNETDQFVVDVNAEINKIVDGYVTKAEKDIAEYKKAFLDTGGSQKEWDEKNIKVNVDYKVEYQKGTTLSLVLIANENWCNAYNVKYYYNLDLANNKKLTLQNVLGKDYVAIANDSIIKQMEQRLKEDPNNIYWGIEGDTSGFPGFKTVDENTKFYINQEGNPVICFEKYEIAPGSMGSQEFEIKK